MFTGAFAVNPINMEKIPIWISDYVLISYGTGAIMAVPGHDSRDFEFAKIFHLPIRQVVSSNGRIDELKEAFTGEGVAVQSGPYDGLPTSEFKLKIAEDLERSKRGKKSVNYKLRDWIFSRQRYWGEPIPLVHCSQCGVVPVKESDLPLILPEVTSYNPTGTGESPLAAIEEWMHTSCPCCGQPAKRESNTMPQWAGSCWYYLRFIDPKNTQAFASKDKLDYWGPVNLYIGGTEHAVLHLLYARFWHKVLYDIGEVSHPEPFLKLRNQGMILGENNEKMSKSKGNVINPDDIIKEHGADALRMYEMFLGPLSTDKPWNTQSIHGVKRFLDKIWNLMERQSKNAKVSEELDRLMHKTIKIISEKIDNLEFNTAISQLMIFSNLLQKEENINSEILEILIKILHPFAPFITEELWERLGHSNSVIFEKWPQYDPRKVIDENVTVIYQVNGKVRSKEDLPKDTDDKALIEKAKANERIRQFIEGKMILKEIVVPNKLVNIVVK